MAEVSFSGVGKTYSNGVVAVRGVDLTIADGELIVLVGPSGCGKSTLLRMVAGLEDVTEGEISLGGRVINRLREAERDVAMVFQNYALYPHLTVSGNIAFPLRIARMNRREREERVKAVAAIVGLAHLLDTKPAQLSGGQRQRVAMARAIVREPQVFLMDEPLSNLDAKLRVEMRRQILDLQRRLGTTMIYVTHDQAEAMTLGDRVVVLRDGLVQQVDVPDVMYQRPANVFVARFLGSPPMNLLLGHAEVECGVVRRVRIGGSTVLELEQSELVKAPGSDGADLEIVAGIRPEALSPLTDGDAAPGRGDGRTLTGTVLLRESLGSDVFVHVAVDDVTALPSAIRELALEAELSEAEEDLTLPVAPLVARLPTSTTVERGDRVTIEVAPGAVRLFDGANGLVLANA